MSELLENKFTQTYKVQAEMLKVVDQFPHWDKSQVMNQVLENLGMDITKKPTVRRAKMQLIKKLEKYLEVLK